MQLFCATATTAHNRAKARSLLMQSLGAGCGHREKQRLILPHPLVTCEASGAGLRVFADGDGFGGIIQAMRQSSFTGYMSQK